MDGEKAERWGLLCLHRDRVVNQMRARGITVEDAEDSVHDALLQLMAHPALDHGRAGSLLSVVALRRAYDRRRRRIRERRAVGRLSGFGDVAVSPADTALDRVEAQWLAGHVQQLPVRQRDVVQGHAGGLTSIETAQSLGISTKAAESALSRARLALRAIVAGATGGLLWMLRRAHSATGPMTAAAATLAAGWLTATAPAADRLPADDGRQPAMGSLAAPDTVAAHTGGRTRMARVALPGVASSHPRGRPGAPAPIPPRPLLGLNGLGNHSTAGSDGGSVQRYDPDATFAQSLQACLTQGVSLDTDHLGCPPQ